MQGRTLCLHCEFEGGNYRHFLKAVFSIFMRIQRVCRYPEEVQAGSERLPLGCLEWEKTTLNKSQFRVWHVCAQTGHGCLVL